MNSGGSTMEAMTSGGSPTTAAAAVAARKVLEKPLSELTEEDIAQLTREDCRRYLKDKGMRRPSWNKSQAIQQVISLKALLEDDPLRKLSVGDQPEPPHRPPSPVPVTTAPTTTVAAGKPQRAATREVPGQMTIFYDGKVSVYNGVAPGKAGAIMHIAASPEDFYTRPAQSNRRQPVRFAPTEFKAGIASTPSIGKLPAHVVEITTELTTPRDTNDAEDTTSRKASLQRYLEKKKDRVKIKGSRLGGISSSNLEMMYINRSFGVQNEPPNQMYTGSPANPRPPRAPTRTNPMDTRTEKKFISFDLNDEVGKT